MSHPDPFAAVRCVEVSVACELLLSFCACQDTEAHKEMPAIGVVRAAPLARIADLLAAVAAWNAGYTNFWVRLLGLATRSSPPKDVPALLAHLAALDPLDLTRMLWVDSTPDHDQVRPQISSAAHDWRSRAQQQFRDTLAPDDHDWHAALTIFLARARRDEGAPAQPSCGVGTTRFSRDWKRRLCPSSCAMRKRSVCSSARSRTTDSSTLHEWHTVRPEAGVPPGCPHPIARLPALGHDRAVPDVKLIGHPVADENIIAGGDAPPERW